MSATIAAYSGGSLPCAIGIIRISGPSTGEILDKIFFPKRGVAITQCKNSTLYYGKLIDLDGATLDICTCAYYKGPKSYTGEDMGELFCHGSRGVIEAALSLVYKLGAAPAKAGEFTRRAFLNGRMDLTGAEAVADLIESTSALSAKNAAAQLEGQLCREIDGVYNRIAALLAHFYAVCDYSDEDIDAFEYDQARAELKDCHHIANALAQGYRRGRLLKDGVPVAIVGKPNGGKSTLFNALCGYDRAIVTDEAGTTRDVIEHTITCGGVALRLFDTAGIRDALSAAEIEGVRRSKITASDAAAVICVIDGSQPLTFEDCEAMELCKKAPRAVLVINKGDLSPDATVALEIAKATENFEQVFSLSAQNREVSPLVDWLCTLAPATSEVLITSARQAALLERTCEDLNAAIAAAYDGVTPDAFLSDTERALRHLGEITGRHPSADIEHEIFSRFCVGK